MTDFTNAYQRILAEVEQNRSHEADSAVLRLAWALAGEEEHGLSCQACDERLPVFIDDEISGLDVARKYPDVKHHLDICPRCAAAYVQLLQLAWLMDTGQIAILGSASPLKLNFLPELAEGDSCND